MTTYYNYLSVRDQLLSARKKSYCDFDLKSGIPRNIKRFSLDEKWEAHCSVSNTDKGCTLGFCDVNIHIFVNGMVIPQTIYLHYEKKEPVAFVFIPTDILDILKTKKILNPALLKVEENAKNILPSMLHQG